MKQTIVHLRLFHAPIGAQSLKSIPLIFIYPKTAHSSRRDGNNATGIEEKATVIQSNTPTECSSNLPATGDRVEIY